MTDTFKICVCNITLTDNNCFADKFVVFVVLLAGSGSIVATVSWPHMGSGYYVVTPYLTLFSEDFNTYICTLRLWYM